MTALTTPTIYIAIYTIRLCNLAIITFVRVRVIKFAASPPISAVIAADKLSLIGVSCRRKTKIEVTCIITISYYAALAVTEYLRASSASQCGRNKSSWAFTWQLPTLIFYPITRVVANALAWIFRMRESRFYARCAVIRARTLFAKWRAFLANTVLKIMTWFAL